MAQISITIPDDKITEIAQMAKAEGMVTEKTDPQIVKEIIRNAIKAHYVNAKQRKLNNVPIEELNI